MTDEEMESRLLDILMQKYRDTIEVRGAGARQTRVRLRSWMDILSRAGCELMPLNASKSDENDIFFSHGAIGTMRVPRDIATKIIALGFIP